MPTPYDGSMSETSSNPFDPDQWREVPGFDFDDITYHRHVRRTGRAERHRPHRLRPPRRPQRLPPAHRRRALPSALDHARRSPDVGHRSCSPATAPAPRTAGGRSAPAAISASAGAPATSTPARARRGRGAGATADKCGRGAGQGRGRAPAHPRGPAAHPHHAQGRDLPWSAAGRPAAGTALHVVSDLTLASREHARFKQTDADVGSFDAGYGSGLPRQAGRPEVRPRDLLPGAAPTIRRARCSTWARSTEVADHADLETTAIEWARHDQRQVARPRSGCSSSPSTSPTTA
jgi:naphthoate synthase